MYACLDSQLPKPGNNSSGCSIQPKKGEEVILERKGTRFRLMLDPGPKSGDPSVALLDVADEDVLSGEWDLDIRS